MDGLVNDLSFSLGIQRSDIDFFLNKENNRRIFRVLKIPKKDGSERVIYAPSPALKRIQYFINETYLSPIPLHSASYAYQRNKSVKQNAEFHKNGTHFLFVDIHDFFNSIPFEKMFLILQKLLAAKLSSEDVRMMLCLCSRNGKFIQGCVTSPALSNIYMYDIDEAFSKLASSMADGRYSRYSDDMTFSSTKSIDSSVLETIEKELASFGLMINKKKTHFSSCLQRVSVTGIRIKDNHSVTLGTAFKKELKNEIFAKLKYGSGSAESAEQILGKLSYLRSIDPSAFRTLNFKYQKDNELLVDQLKKLRASEK